MGTVKPVLSDHSKRRPKLVFKTDYRFKQVKSIAECSKRAFCNAFNLHWGGDFNNIFPEVCHVRFGIKEMLVRDSTEGLSFVLEQDI